MPGAVLVACQRADDGSPSEVSPFGPDFRWGTATAGFQVDMGCPTWSAERCDDTASDWYDWVTDPEIVAQSNLFVKGDPVSMRPGMWETLEADAALMEEVGLNAYRMSVEWSRLFSDGGAEAATTVDELDAWADPNAVARYHAMLAALEERGIEPLVTMNHYTLPSWVHDGLACHADLGCAASGWVDEARITRLVGLYAGWLGREFGADVDRWMTLNEPFATTLSGYLFPSEDRSAPPGVPLEIEAGVAVMLAQIVGHAVMYDAVHLYDTVDADGDGEAAQVGIVMNMADITPKNPDDPADLVAAEHADYLYHRLYLDAITSGAWDPTLDGTPDSTRADLAGRLDLLGINYYNELFVTGLPFPIEKRIPAFDFYPEFSWAPHPEGLGDVVTRATEWAVPIMISENGTPYVDQGPEVLEGHLGSLAAAMEAGADVRGYFYWSFVDNYEWNHGFDLRFGLYELDVVTKERIPRATLDRYREIIAAGL